MKKTLLALLFLGAAFGVFGQRLSSVGILPFEAAEGVSPGEADALARQVAAELG